MEVRAVADGGRDRDDGHADEPANDACEGALHAGHDDDHRGGAQLLVMTEESMDSGDTDIEEMLGGIAHRPGSFDGLFGDWDIGCSRRDDENCSATFRLDLFLVRRDGSCHRIVFRGADDFFQRRKMFDVGAGCKENATVADDPTTDFCNLPRGLSFTQNDFGKSLPHFTVMVDHGEIEWLGHPRFEGVNDLLKVQFSRFKLRQEGFQAISVHDLQKQKI